MPQPLLDVEVQGCLINDYTRHIPRKVALILATGDYEPVMLTVLVSSPESTFRRLLEWHECEPEPGTSLVAEITAPEAPAA